jgi:hypothetical protein
MLNIKVAPPVWQPQSRSFGDGVWRKTIPKIRLRLPPDVLLFGWKIPVTVKTSNKFFVLTFNCPQAIFLCCFWLLFRYGRKKDFTVLPMGKAKEQRAEKRLRYRWHARFALNPKQKPLSGQMVDVSSKGMALLYHNDESCPGPDQLITTNFGVPYFDSGDSFDTVFFNRTGRVCRIDNLTSKVNRIAIQFAEPLFFKPGEQDISYSDAKQRLQAKAKLIAGAKERTTTKIRKKVSVNNKAKSNTEEIARFCSEALARAEEKAKAQSKARAKAETKVKSEARLRAKAEKNAAAEAKKRAKIEADMHKKIELYAEQLAKIKAQAAQEIAKIKAEADDRIAKTKAEYKRKLHQKSQPKKNTKEKVKKSREGVLMDKVDKFITNRNRIF